MPSLDSATLSFILAIAGGIGMLFTAYNVFHKPQDILEKQQIISEQEIDGKASVLAQKEMESKATLLAQQVQWEREANDKKFVELSMRISESITMAQNHLHTVDVKIDGLLQMIGSLNVEITKLSTIIHERIPRKQ